MDFLIINMKITYTIFMSGVGIGLINKKTLSPNYTGRVCAPLQEITFFGPDDNLGTLYLF